MDILHTLKDLRHSTKSWHSAGLRIGVVPTMGALHKGHISLVDAIAPHCDRVIVTIFVNPKQFGAGEDLDAYPRTLKADCEKLTATRADLVYAPSIDQIYPAGFDTEVSVGAVATGYEGDNRPGHFDGVATVVTKLLLQSSADVAIFGEKDYQQLAVIRHFVADLDIDCAILGGAIMREEDGLACSSRNVYLSPEQRRIAPRLFQALKHMADQLRRGMTVQKAEETASEKLLEAGFDAIDYVSVADAQSLAKLKSIKGHDARILAVARLGKTRLLDNIAV